MKRFLYLSGFPFLFLVIGCLLTIKYEASDPVLVAIVFFFLPFLISTASYVVLLRSKKIGAFYYIISCLPLVTFLLVIIRDKLKWFLFLNDDFLFGIFFGSYTASVLAFTAAIPGAILPYFRARKSVLYTSDDQIGNLDFVNLGMDTIKEKFNDVQTTINRERAGIETALAQLLTNLTSYQKNLKQVQAELTLSRNEAMHYKELASLTKEQQNALLMEFGKQKYVDYIIGFVLGIVGSVLVDYFPQIYKLIVPE